MKVVHATIEINVSFLWNGHSITIPEIKEEVQELEEACVRTEIDTGNFIVKEYTMAQLNEEET